MARLVALAIVWTVPLMGLAQQHLIGEDDVITACGFYFLDDGGALNDASSTGDLTTTFCPEAPAGELTFSFSTFSLGAGDTLFLWQGSDTLGPPSFSFAGNALLGSDIGNGDAVSNPSGCMTWRFSPGGAGGSNWAALVGCSTPCDRPVVSASVSLGGQLQASPVEACLGAGVVFDASGSDAAVGLEGGTWSWDFGDGALTGDGAVVEHAYSNPGVYPVKLTFTDSEGCSSINSLDWTVHVAAAMVIDAPAVGPLVCAGGTAVLALGPEGVTTQEVESQPVASFGAGIMIPDSVGQTFSSEITFSGFPLGQSVTDVGDISGIRVNLEHSFILDLAIELECPNGSSMILQGWPGGFGGCVDAGIPVTGDTPPQPGMGYEYSWAPTATEDWQTAAMGLLPTPNSGCASSTMPLPAGDYAATGDWNQLLGCPVNGTWTLSISDTQAGDNGFLFGWAIDFAPDITPEQTVFEATVGSSCDSMFWAPMEPWGFDMAALDGCSGIVVEPTQAGTFGYVFTAVDAFGCSADTVVFVTVEPGLEFEMGSSLLAPLAGVETTLCSGQPLTLQATSTGPVPPGTSFNWLVDGVPVGQVGPTYVDAAPDTGLHEILFQATTAAPPPIVGLCQFEWKDTIEVVVPPEVALTAADACSNEPVQWEAPTSGDDLAWNWIFSTENGDTLSQVSWANPVLGTQPPGAYVLEATVTDGHGCSDMSTDSFEVFTAPNPGFTLEDVCAGEVLAFSLSDSIGYADVVTSADWSLVGAGALTDFGGHLGTSATGGGGFPQITLDLVTAYPEGITCSASQSVYAMVHSNPVVAIVGPDFACQGDDPAWWGWASVPFPGSVVSSDWSLEGALSLTQEGGDSLALMEPPVGSYELNFTAVSDQGCHATQGAVFDVFAMPDASFTLPSTVCLGEPVEQVMSWTNGGASVHSWTANGDALSVSDGHYAPSLTAVAGVVEVQHVVSIGGCSDTAAATMEVAPLPVAGFSGPSLACEGDAVVWTDNSINPTSSVLTKTWMPLYAGAPAASSGVLFDFGVPAPGDYGMSLAVTTAAGCSDTLSASLFVGASPDAAFTLDPVCSGGVVPVTLSDPTGYGAASAEWQWNGAPLTVPDPTVLPASFSSVAGLQTAGLSLSLSHPGITCTSDHTASVAVYAQPSAAFSAPVDFCSGPDASFSDATVVDAGTAVTLDWTLDSGSGPAPWGGAPTVVLAAPAPGTYAVALTATTPDGCTSTAADTVTVYTAADATFALPAVLCAGSPLEVSAPMAGLGTWTANGDALSVSDGHYASSLTAVAGVVEVQHVVSIGGCSDTAAATMEVAPLPVAGFSGPSLACEGDAVVWTDNSINPTSSVLTKTWMPLYAGAPAASSGVLFDFGVPAPGDYGMSLAVTTAAGCSDTLSASLFVGASPDAAFTLDPVCSGGVVPVTLSDPAGYGAASAEWQWNGAPLTVPDPTVLPASFSSVAGLQTAGLSLSLSHPGITCTSDHTASVAVYAQPSAAFSAPVDFCSGPDASFSDATVVDAGTAVTLDWTLDSGSGPAPWGGAPTVVLNAPSPGMYAVALTATTPDGCTSTAADTVTVYTAADATFALPAVLCAGSPLEVSAPMAGLGTWTANGDALSVSDGHYAPSLTAVAGVVEVQHVVSIGGCSDTAAATMEVAPLPVAGFSGPSLACEGDAVVWTDNSINPTSSVLTKTWMPLYAGAPAASSGVLFDFGVPAPGDYGMSLAVTTAAGCSDTLSASLFVGASPDAAFTLDPVCSGGVVPVTLSDPAGYGAASAEWQWNGAPLTVPDPTVLPASFSSVAGLQTAGLSLSLSHPGITCTSDHTVSVAVYAQPSAAFSAPSDFCSGPDASFSDATVVDAGTAVTLDWTLDSGSGPAPWGGAPTVVLAAPAPGTYAVALTATTPDGCSSTAADTVTVYTAPQADFTLPTTVCTGVAVPVPSVATPGTETWTLNGQPLATNAGAFGAALTADFGSQEVGVTVSLGEGVNQCVDQHTENLEVQAHPEVNFTGPEAACAGGAVNWEEDCIHPQGLPMSMVWNIDSNDVSGMDSGVDLSGLSVGQHDVVLTVSGPAGCMASLQGGFEVHAVPEAAFSLSEACSGQPLTWASVAPEGMFFGEQAWSWQGAPLEVSTDTLPAVVSVDPGNPTVVLQLTMDYSTGVSCVALDSVSAVVHETPQASIAGPSHLCAGDTGSFLGGGGGIADPLTFGWALGDSAFDGEAFDGANLDFSNVNTGFYTVFLEATATSGCASVATATVEVVSAPEATFEMPIEVCAGEALPLTFGPSSTDAALIDSTWTWNGVPLDPVSDFLPPWLTSAPGTQAVSLFVTLSQGGASCTSQVSKEVEVHAVPEVVWDLPAEVCSGLPLIISSVAQVETSVPISSTWTWSQAGDTLQASDEELEMGMPAAGEHEVALLVESIGGCSAQLIGAFTAHPTPVADFTATDVCAGVPMPVELNGTAIGVSETGAWTWNGNATTVSEGFLNPMVSAVYGPQMLGFTRSTTFASGHVCSDSHMVTAQVWPAPTAFWNAPGGICAGDAALFEGGGAMVTGDSLSTTWTWETGSNSAWASGEEAAFGVPEIGLYQLEMAVISAQGCTDTLATMVEVHPLPTVDFEVEDVCEGMPVEVEWSVDTMGSGAAFTWMWGGEEVTLTDLTLPLEISTNAGVQAIQLVGEEVFETGAVCAAGNEVFAAVYAAPEAAVSSDTLWCEGETVSVHEAVTGEGGWTCTWSSDVGVAEGPEWTLPEGVLGNIPAVLTVTNAAGCSDTMSFNVRIDPLPQVTLSDSILMECAPFEPEVEAEISGHFGTVLSTVWTWAGGQSTSQSWSEEVEEGSWPVSCTVSAGNADLQCTTTASVSVIGLEVPQAEFDMYPEQPTTRNPEVALTAQVGAPAALDWSVNAAPAGSGAAIGYTFAPYFGDTYEVCLTATSSFGCADESCREVEVIGEVQVYVPSGFSPDNDGINDRFLPSVFPIEQVEDYRLEVYNRWGEPVFVTEDPEQGWMGAYNSGDHFAGNEVFNWVIIIDTQLGLPQKMVGQVTLIR